MAVKFLSFLGTNLYLECSYYFNDPKEEYYPTRFVQVAIVRSLIEKQQLNEQSKILIFATDEAYRKNWYDSDFKGENLQGLKSSIQILEKEKSDESIKFPYFERVPLAEGKSEEELWEIFNTLVNNVEYGDSIYFDITPSFRSLPMLTMIVLNFLRVTKKVEIKGIYYGAFEPLGNINDIKKMNIALRNAPIFDLTPFVDLFYWTSAAHEFITTGNTKLLTALTKRKVQPILQEKKDFYQDAFALNELSKKLSTFTDNLLINNGPELPKILTNLFDSISEAEIYVNKIPPLKDLFDIIISNFSSFNKNSDDFEKLNFAIDYCFRHGLIQQGFTLLEENFISFGCNSVGLNYNKSTHRQIFTSSLFFQEKNIKKSEWKIPKGLKKQEFYGKVEATIKHDLSRFIKFKNDLFPIRNKLNHAGFIDKNKQSYNKLKGKGYNLLKEFKDIMQYGKK